MGNIKIAVFLFAWFVNANASNAQQTRREEKRPVPVKTVPTTEQSDKQAPKPSASSWQTLSDQQIARMLFPHERLYFQPGFEGIQEDLTTVGWGVVVHNVKRVVANLDDDPEAELAVLVLYSTGLCTSCGGQAIVAILDKHNAQLGVPWSTKEGEAYDRDGTTNISTVKLIRKDPFYELAVALNTSPLSIQPHKVMHIIRWDGKKFTTIWNYDLESFSGGERSDIPHDYLAKVDFLDENKGAKRIRVTSIYVTWPHAVGKQRRQFKLKEEFAWSDTEQKYLAIQRDERKYEKGEVCVFHRQQGRDDYRDCRNIEPKQ